MTPKKRFILDENILIFAQTGRNQFGEEDPTCTNLVNQIINICHTIVLDNPLWDRYRRQLDRFLIEAIATDPTMIRVLNTAIQTDGKIDGFHRGPAPPFEGEERIATGSQDDLQVTVRLAVDTGAILVTSDTPLRDDLLEAGTIDQHRLTVVSPEDALFLL